MTSAFVSYAMPDYTPRLLFEADEFFDTAAKQFGGEHTGSGAGLGGRDIDYSFPNREYADAFADYIDVFVEYGLPAEVYVDNYSA